MNRWAITLLLCLLLAGRLTYAQAQPSAGIQAYAEAQPTFNYIEKDAGGQKVGEAHLKGHFEAAARLFLELAGAFFVDLDSPWWSPVGDDHWEWPFGSVVYPIGDEMGVGADVDWLVGSPEVPELTFSPVKFDPDKFLSDMTKDPDNLGEKGKGGDEKKDGAWTDEGGGSKEAQTTDPKADPKKENAPKEDLTKLDDNTKYMRALDEVGKIGDAAKGKGLGKGILSKKLKAIKAKYALQTIEMIDAKDESVKVLVRQKDKDNSTNPIEIKLLGKAELDKEFAEAVADLELKLKMFGDPKTGAVTKAQAETAANETDLHFEVIDGVHVEVDGDQVVIKGDVGAGAPKKMASKPLAKGMEPEVEGAAGETDVKADAKTDTKDVEGDEVVAPIIGLTAAVKVDGGHTVKLEGTNEKLEINVYSTPKSLNSLIVDKQQEIHEAKDTDPDYLKKNGAIGAIKQQKKTLGDDVGAYKRAVDKSYKKGSKKSEAKTTHTKVKTTLGGIAENLDVIGVERKSWDLPETKVVNSMEGGKAKRVSAEPLSKLPGKFGGSAASTNPKGWESIDVSLRAKGDWVRSHLLSHKLNGPGDQAWNLFPATHEMNLSNMENQVESDAKSKLANGEVLFYTVELTYGNKGEYDFIPTSVFMEFGRFDKVTNKRAEVLKSVTFTQEPPSVGVAALNNLNTSSAKSLTETADAAGKTGMHGFFVNVAKERKNGNFTSNRDTNLTKKLQKYYAEDSNTLKNHVQVLVEMLDNGTIIL